MIQGLEMNFWAVGSSHAGKDQTDNFILDEHWYDGYAADNDDRNRSVLNQVKEGDILLMKSSATKGKGHKTAFTRLKGIGRVERKKDWYLFDVNWISSKELPKDFEDIAYRTTIEFMREDKMLNYAKQVISERLEHKNIDEISKLLKYKHQVILQGPPGTGKTRLAKLVAEDLTHIEQKGKPQDILDNLVQSFDSSTDTVQSNRTKFKKLLTEFQKTFPTDSLKDITVDEFAIGNGKNDSFCWWIERGLEDIGKFFPGSSNNYPIYWSKDKNQYVINKKVGDDIKDEESAIKIIANQLVKLVQESDLERSIAFFGKSFTLKILNSYYPDKYFPINSENALNHALKLFGVYDRKMNLIEKNKKLYAIYHDKKDEFKKDITVNEFAG